jgi:hypothetical protein
VGQIWAGDYDIDVAGELLDGTALFGECKWWTEHVGANVLDHLMACAARTSYGRDAPARHYLLYARTGFTEEVRRRAAEASAALHLLTPRELLGRG